MRLTEETLVSVEREVKVVSTSWLHQNGSVGLHHSVKGLHSQ